MELALILSIFAFISNPFLSPCGVPGTVLGSDMTKVTTTWSQSYGPHRPQGLVGRPAPITWLSLLKLLVKVTGLLF